MSLTLRSSPVLLSVPPVRAKRAGRTSNAVRTLLLGSCLALSTGAFAQLIPGSEDWKESDAPPAPMFDVTRLVPVEQPAYSSLRYGIDPATIVITGDGVVRYVMVASNASGAVNAFYEGVRCATAEVKSYASSTGADWNVVKQPGWIKIATMSSPRTKEVARQVLCRGNAPRDSVRSMLDHLKNPLPE